MEATYFDTISVRTRILEDHILLIAHTPLITTPQIYDAYKISALPNPIPSDKSTKPTTYTMLQNLPDYILISRDKQTYVEMSQDQYHNCIGYHFTVCANILQPKSIHTPSCLSSIYFDQKQDIINKLCTFIITNKPMPPSIEYVGRSSFLIINNTNENHISCPNQNVKYLSPAITQIITLGCGCSLTLENNKLSSVSTSCKTNFTIDVVLPLNTPVLHYFNTSLPKHLSSTSANVSNTAPSKSYTQLNGLHTALKQIQQSDIAFHTNLKQLDNDNLFNSLSSPEYNANFDHTMFASFIVIEGILSIITGLAVIWLILKLNMLKTVIFALTTTEAAATQIQPQNEIIWNIKIPNILWIINLMIFVFLLVWTTKLCLPYITRICSIITIRYCPGFCKSFTSTPMDIFLKISANSHHALIHLSTINLESGEKILMTSPKCVKALIDNGVFTSTLRIKWFGEILIHTNSHPQIYYLPTKINISPTVGRTVAQALASDNRIYNLQHKIGHLPLTSVPNYIPHQGIHLTSINSNVSTISAASSLNELTEHTTTV